MGKKPTSNATSPTVMEPFTHPFPPEQVRRGDRLDPRDVDYHRLVSRDTLHLQFQLKIHLFPDKNKTSTESIGRSVDNAESATRTFKYV